MGRNIRISICCAFLVLFVYPKSYGQVRSRGFHPDKQTAIVAQSGPLTVRLKVTKDQLYVVVESGRKRDTTLALPQEMAQVDAIHFVENNKIAVVGAVNGQVDQVVVIDPAVPTVIDRFYCYEPVLSPTKRFLAFIKFFPPHFVQGVSTVYLLYDFQKSPGGNRPGKLSANDPQNVGQVLYPRMVRNEIGDNTGQPPSKVHMLVSGTFFWSPDGQRIAFADLHQGRVNVVMVSLQDSVPRIELHEKELRKPDVCLDQTDLESCSFGVSSIQFEDQNLRITFRSLAGGIHRDMVLPF